MAKSYGSSSFTLRKVVSAALTPCIGNICDVLSGIKGCPISITGFEKSKPLTSERLKLSSNSTEWLAWRRNASNSRKKRL